VPADSPRRALWSELTTTELYGILKLRTDVFFVEQRVDESELDWRDAEPATVHYWLERDGEVVACLRVLRDDEAEIQDAYRSIGRVVVHAGYRGQGLAQQLMAEAIAEFGEESMLLHAQTYAMPLYARSGFVAVGEEYEEAGIPHTTMFRPGDADSSD
jgi:ElaA protein